MFGRKEKKIPTPKFYGSLGAPVSTRANATAESRGPSTGVSVSLESASAGAGVFTFTSNSLPHYHASQPADIELRSPEGSRAPTPSSSPDFLIDLSAKASETSGPTYPPFNSNSVLENIAKQAVLKDDAITLGILFSGGVRGEKYKDYKHTIDAKAYELTPYEEYHEIKDQIASCYRKQHVGYVRLELAKRLKDKLNELTTTSGGRASALTVGTVFEPVANEAFENEFYEDYKNVIGDFDYVFCKDLYKRDQQLKEELDNHKQRIKVVCVDVLKVLKAKLSNNSYHNKVRELTVELNAIIRSAESEMDSAAKQQDALSPCMTEIHDHVGSLYHQIFDGRHPNEMAFSRLDQYGNFLCDTDIVALFFSNLDVNFRGKTGNTLLHLAVAKNKPKAFAALIKNAADVNVKNSEDISPLDMVYYYERLSFLHHIKVTGDLAQSIVNAQVHIKRFYEKTYPRIKDVLVEYGKILAENADRKDEAYEHRQSAYRDIVKAFDALPDTGQVGLQSLDAGKMYKLLLGICWLGGKISEFYTTKNVHAKWYELGRSRLLDTPNSAFVVSERLLFCVLVKELRGLEKACLERVPETKLSPEQKIRLLEIRKREQLSAKSEPVAIEELIRELIKEQSEAKAKLQNAAPPVSVSISGPSSVAESPLAGAGVAEFKSDLLSPSTASSMGDYIASASNAEIAVLKAENEDLRKQLAKSKEDNTTLKESVDVLKKDRSDLLTKKADIEEKLSEAKDKIEALEAELEIAKSQFKQTLKNKSAIISSLKEQLRSQNEACSDGEKSATHEPDSARSAAILFADERSKVVLERSRKSSFAPG